MKFENLFIECGRSEMSEDMSVWSVNVISYFSCYFNVIAYTYSILIVMSSPIVCTFTILYVYRISYIINKYYIKFHFNHQSFMPFMLYV